jgi:hypothetical protein
MASILTPQERDDFLSEEALDLQDLDARVDTAELWVVEYFRDKYHSVGVRYFDNSTSGIVTLDGWETDSNGNPDPSAMPDDLAFLLRQAIADVVHHTLEEEKHEDVKSVQQGDRSKSYSGDPTLQSRALRVLESRFDYSEGFTGFW